MPRQIEQECLGAGDRRVEIGQRSTVGRGPQIEESGSGGSEHVVALQGLDQARPTVLHQTGLEGAAPSEGEHRLTFARSIRVLHPGDLAHLDVVNGRDEIGLTTGVADPLLESTPSVPTVDGHRHGGIGGWSAIVHTRVRSHVHSHVHRHEQQRT